MPVIDDIWQEILKHTQYSNVVLTALWQRLQRQQSEQTPDDWIPTYAVVGSSHTVQLLPHNPNRASCSIVNNGADTLIVSNRNFDVNEATSLETNAVSGTVAQFLLLDSGQDATIGSRGAVYAVSLGTSSVQIVETIYAVSTADAHKQHIHAGGIDSMLERGVPLNGDEIPRNRTIV